MSGKKITINFKKLFFETMVTLAIVSIATVQLLTSAISAYGVIEVDKYEKYREIVDYVESYDYAQGRDNTLEKRLDSLFANSRDDEQFFNGLARAIYYCNVGFYRTAEDTFKEIEFIAPDENELLDAKTRAVLCERKSHEK